MSELGQKRRFGGQSTTSGLPRTTDIVRAARYVSTVPTTEVVHLPSCTMESLKDTERRRALNGSIASAQPQPPILSAQSEIVLIASGKLPTWQWAWACSSAVNTRVVIERAADNERSCSHNCGNGT